MRAVDFHSVAGAAGSCCSALSALMFGAVPFFSLLSPDFTVSHPWLFLLGALAFLTNLMDRVDPFVRAAAALVQAICVFELIGFSVGVTVIASTGEIGFRMMRWWAWMITWGLLGICVAAMVLSTWTSRPR
jgi:hypothetical protein